MSDTREGGPQPLASYIKLDASGEPSLSGYQCAACGEVLLEYHRACPNCTEIDGLGEKALSPRGKLFTYTIVYRSFPGVEVPFISAIVRLEEGAYIRGNLDGVECDPAAISFDMPVVVRFERLRAAGGAGRSFLRYVFAPA